MKVKILIAILCSLNIFNTRPFKNLNINEDTFKIIYELNEEGLSPNSYLSTKNIDFTNLKEIWATTNVNVRKLPNSNSIKITSLQTGDSIKKIKDLPNGWTQVIYKDEICFINSKYLSNEKIEKQNVSTININTISTGINITIKGNCKNIELIKKYSTYIPQNIIDYLNNNNWEIILTTENLAKKHFELNEGSIQGITIYGEKKIEIEDREKAIKNALIHEIGHALDGAFYESHSTKEDFVSIFNEENQNIKNLQGVNKNDLLNPMEYFAESFKQYIMNKESLQKVAPKTYSYMENFITLF